MKRIRAEENEMCANKFTYIIATIIGLSAAYDFASATTIKQLRAMAPLEIEELKTRKFESARYRAILGREEIYQFFVIEKIQPGRTEGDPDKVVRQWKIADVKGANAIKMGSLWRISDLAWESEELRFSNFSIENPQASKNICTIVGFQRDNLSVFCKKS